jgi:hypothetical protein
MRVGWLAYFNPQAGHLGGIARTASPRRRGLAATRTCAGALLLCRQVGERAREPQWLSRSSFSVNLEVVGSEGVQSLLTAPRRINPGAVASTGPCELIFLGRKRRCSSVNTGATGRTSAATMRVVMRVGEPWKILLESCWEVLLESWCFFFAGGGGVRSRRPRPRPAEAAYPALTGRAAHSVEARRLGQRGLCI